MHILNHIRITTKINLYTWALWTLAATREWISTLSIVIFILLWQLVSAKCPHVTSASVTIVPSNSMMRIILISSSYLYRISALFLISWTAIDSFTQLCLNGDNLSSLHVLQLCLSSQLSLPGWNPSVDQEYSIALDGFYWYLQWCLV